MSKRTPEQITERAEYLVSHEAQIDALTREGIDDWQRVSLFMAAAQFQNMHQSAAVKDFLRGGQSAPAAVWQIWGPPHSLFADLPGCGCPVREKLPGVPHWDYDPPINWRPTADELRVFSRIQIERRFGE